MSWNAVPEQEHHLSSVDLQQMGSELSSSQEDKDDEKTMKEISERKPTLESQEPPEPDPNSHDIITGSDSDWTLPGTNFLPGGQFNNSVTKTGIAPNSAPPSQTLPASFRLHLVRSSLASRVLDVLPPSPTFPEYLWESACPGGYESEPPPCGIDMEDAFLSATVAATAQEEAELAARQAALEAERMRLQEKAIFAARQAQANLRAEQSRLTASQPIYIQETDDQDVQMMEAPALEIPPTTIAVDPESEDDNDVFATPPSSPLSSHQSSEQGVIIATQPPEPPKIARKKTGLSYIIGLPTKTAEQEFLELQMKAKEEASSMARATRARKSSVRETKSPVIPDVQTPVPMLTRNKKTLASVPATAPARNTRSHHTPAPSAMRSRSGVQTTGPRIGRQEAQSQDTPVPKPKKRGPPEDENSEKTKTRNPRNIQVGEKLKTVALSSRRRSSRLNNVDVNVHDDK